MSFLQHPQGKVGIFRLPEQAKEPFLTNETQENTDHNEAFCVSELSLALDGVQDPGNLGYNYSHSRLVWNKAYILFDGYSRLLESKGGASHYGGV